MEKTEKSIQVGAREKLPFWFGLAWSSRGVSAALNVVLLGFITYYCTDLLGLNAGIVGTILLGSKVIDAATDLIAGYVIDKTRTRWGKARPYEVFIVLLWVFTIMIFNVPNIGQTGQYVYVFILYVLINAVCATALGGADAVYMARAIKTENNRIKVMSINGVMVMFIAIIFNIVMPLIIAGLGATKEGWFSISLYMGVPLAFIGLLRFIFVKEIKDETDNIETESRHAEKKEESLKFKTVLKLLGKNKYIFIIVALMLLTNISNGLATATTYYFKYIIGDISLMSVASMTALITPFVLIIFPLLSRKLGTTKLLQVFTVIGIIGLIIRTIGGTNMTTILIGGLLASLASIPISMMINTYLIDCMDYGEWKTGVRVEGSLASVVNFSGKLGSAIASGFVGLIMGLTGYNGSLAVQSDSANIAIIGLYNFFPLVLLIIMFILSLMYNVDKFRPQMREELAKKRVNG
jgi:Na+/melibiose symporter-like transporter